MLGCFARCSAGVKSLIVVIETDSLAKLASAAVERLGKALRNGRAVKAAANRFAERIAANPKSLQIDILDVVGFCDPANDGPSVHASSAFLKRFYFDTQIDAIWQHRNEKLLHSTPRARIAK